eukprot:TRINITY_DN1629_c0_g1_i1.p1 TRINITY_DN1629_c0_g1~~TRINITY_DN1629_c0_g1_i1.p1  ORF type:complete len:151 (+),score=19.06 TRINITY_DN1629_c0_g1_i1:51-503(+)
MVSYRFWKEQWTSIVRSLKYANNHETTRFVSVILYNTKGTKVAKEFSKDVFKNLTELRDLQQPSASFIHDLKTISEQPPEPLVGGQIEFQKVLEYCQNSIDYKDPNFKKFGYRRIFFFTRNDKPLVANIATTKVKAKDMRDSGVEINLFP